LGRHRRPRQARPGPRPHPRRRASDRGGRRPDHDGRRSSQPAASSQASPFVMDAATELLRYVKSALDEHDRRLETLEAAQQPCRASVRKPRPTVDRAERARPRRLPIRGGSQVRRRCQAVGHNSASTAREQREPPQRTAPTGPASSAPPVRPVRPVTCPADRAPPAAASRPAVPVALSRGFPYRPNTQSLSS
jgi:hypothetical protein